MPEQRFRRSWARPRHPPRRAHSQTAQHPPAAPRSTGGVAGASATAHRDVHPGNRGAQGAPPLVAAGPGSRDVSPPGGGQQSPDRSRHLQGVFLGDGRGPCSVARRVERTNLCTVWSAMARPSSCCRHGQLAWSLAKPWGWRRPSRRAGGLAGDKRGTVPGALAIMRSWGRPPVAYAANQRPTVWRWTPRRCATRRRVRACRVWRRERACTR
jgi:hypothetical protein